MGLLTCCCDLTPDPSHSPRSCTRLRTLWGNSRTLLSGRGLGLCLVLTFLILQCVNTGNAFEVHVFSDDSSGSDDSRGSVPVFNASLGHNWSYYVDFNTSQPTLQLFQLDSSTGVLYWRGKTQCSRLHDNPFKLNIVSRTWQWSSQASSNSTIVPYSVFVNGCRQSHRTLKYKRLKDDVHQIEIRSKLLESDCIPPLTYLMNINSFLPQTIRQCQIYVDLPVSSPVIFNDNHVFTTAVKMCFIEGHIVVRFSISVFCDQSQEFDVPFRLSITPYSKVTHAVHRRSRRAANNQPQFDPTKYIEHVKEEQPPGVQVVTITATDTDTEGAGTLTYSMRPTRDVLSQSRFVINPLTGTINTTVKLDRETIRAHYFLVTATDHGVPVKSATASLTIIVDDVNDHAPQFNKQVFNVSVSENQAVDYPVLTVQATDKDFGDNSIIRYNILNPGSPNDAFKIDPVHGEISTMQELDRESHQHYQLLIQAVDQGDFSERKSSTATVNITITDDNDNAPVFSETSYRINIREDQAASNSNPILQVTATDADDGENADILYQLSGNNHEKFHIDANNGKIYLVEELDYEYEEKYQLTVRAEDQAIQSMRLRGTASVLVHVIDVNDNAPFFTSLSYTADVVENSDPGASIIQVQAVDRDSGQNSELSYSFVSSNDNQSIPVVIDSLSGWITTSGKIDREHRQEYSLVVKVVDNGSPKLSATTSVTIGIRDINDNAPVFTSRIYDASVSEEANIGDEVIRVTAEDQDEGENARVHYEITSGNIGDAFLMISSQGLITVKKKLDARQNNRYALTVIATDNGGRKDTAQVFINITDTNRYAPEFQATPFQFAVDENIPIGTSVFKVRAIDRDRGENARITYSLHPGVKAFAIDPNTGEITTRVTLNRESQPAYMLRVTATDNGKPQLQDSETIDVTINDENDNKPEFSETIYSGDISEDALPGESVLQIRARDYDKDANGQVFYTFKGGNDGNGDFSIDSALGMIRVAKYLDRERIPNYELVALAVDRGTPPQSSSVIVRIKVNDVNDNHPQFEASELNVYIAENSPIGSTVAQITAVDPDEGINALVEYSFAGGPDVDSFQLSGRRGEPAIITTLIPLDYESDKKRYEVILRAASETQFSTTTVFINVRDVNDNTPKLQDFSIIYNNYGGSFPREPIGRIPAFDPDVSDQELLVYKIVSGNEAGLLELNVSTGEIKLDSRLDSDVPRNGTFKVSVSDGKNEVKATCRLYVRLVTPEMLHDSVTIRLNKMTESAFLSSLLKFFTDALANIFSTDPTNIFIINIEDDTDVAPAQILNVSVSVRQGSVTVQGRTQDVFYSPEYLREYIYLYRSHLANLSALQVLPFDDNLCLIEPCPSYSVCQSMVRWGEPRPFISSSTVLFRPIHPDNGYKCPCPHGFAGRFQANDCDVEVDLCYSMPCQNRGTCIPHESGYTCACSGDFTGENCEVNMTMKYDAISCPQDFCGPPSVCVPLIKGGFRCDGCPDDGNYDQFCRLKVRSFRKASYMTFPSLKSRNRFTIRMMFATQEKSGLLLYNGRFNEEHDFVGLEIVDSQVMFSFCLGDNITRVSTYIPGGVSTGQWFEVTLEYHQRVATLTVGEDCDTNIAILYGDKLDNYSCAARVVHVLPEICENPIKNCHRLLDLTGPLQLGGLPWAPSTGQVTQQDFVGCIKDVYIDNQLLDLNTSVVSVQTGVGCPQKETHCQSAPCTLGGKCKEGWTTFTCDCPEKTGGKDCSQVIERSRQLDGKGYLSFSSISQNKVHYPWYNGIAFRTRAEEGTLMQLILNTGQVRMQLIDGFIQYTFEDNSVTLDAVKVSDGQWHYIEARWYQGRMELLLDYGQIQKSTLLTRSVSGSDIQIVYVGAYRQGNDPMSDGLVGCVKDIRVGNNPNAVLSQPSVTGATEGCSVPSSCDPNPCGPGTCSDTWGDYECKCPPGTIGPRCEDICSEYNPCQNWAECERPSQGESTYTCECGSRQSGRYCQNVSPLECPAAWWGNPVCGPCLCDTSRGFDKNCNKKNGTCHCKELHYQPEGSDRCFPCNCYSEGSKGHSCNPHTGQCECREGITGRRCDQCDSIFAGIDLAKKTCKVMSYEDCPRNFAKGVWWDPVPFGDVAIQDCPEGSFGTAKRVCTQLHSWLEADLFNCTSDNFTRLQSQLEALQAELQTDSISAFSADLAIELLKNATNTTTPLYGGDVIMTMEFAKVVLLHENKHTDLELISQQYRDFVQQLVIALSNVTSLPNAGFWPRINSMYKGSATLLQLLEEYLRTIAKSMPQAQSGPFEAVSDGIVLGVDWMSKYNGTVRPLPKYDNIINKGSANDFASIILPSSLFAGSNQQEKSYGYAIYHTMGKLVDMNTDESVVKTGLPLTTNGPMFSFVLSNKSQQVSASQPVYVRLKLAAPHNRTNLQCAIWRPGSDGRGIWSASECTVSDIDCRVTSESEHCREVYVTCKCTHMSTYAVIVDLEDGTLPKAAIVQLEALMYVLVAVSLALLIIAFFILISFKALQSNWNSIHINLVFVIVNIDLAFAVGINRTSPELFCRLVAISLHYFYMAAFAWLYVEILHIYRMLTEKQTINYGSMKFYYLLGYVIPGIIVGLAVGLYTDGYGNDSFCWLETSELFIWSFAGPIVVVVVLNIITFMLAVKASCREKIQVSDISSIRLGLMGAILLLLLLSVTWVMGLLAVNFDLPALGYVHSIFMFLQGLFLFIVYILLSRKVRLCLKTAWYKLQGKKLNMDENLTGTRSSVMSRSALAYRNDTASSAEGGMRINVGISTTSTTSQSSKSTGRYPPRYRDDFGRSTSSSTSAGHVASGTGQIPNTGVAPYGYDPNITDPLPEDKYEGQSPSKPEGNDSDSDSDASMDRNSLDLASSHSSDEDDDFEIGPPWDQHIPKSKAVAQAREQLEKHKKEKERERLGNNNSEQHGVNSGQVDISVDLDPPPTSRPHISSVPPDVTLSAAAQRSGRKVTIVPPVRSDSLQNNYATSSSNVGSDVAASGRVQVQVLTHNGSLSSESESSDETNV
ncbi:LOW QUALITY PROTEIN: cadherin EGF LAG seven-pass G-type receptor 2-like [Babylonia areolata]|uniref:LOW QUALITY PROTEIN: cadherin EGF LAG seven-pass G-type receptor 2-like n=1 Tax=Babylonia areolata TaxID=304850 RepID=UPI003FD14804